MWSEYHCEHLQCRDLVCVSPNSHPCVPWKFSEDEISSSFEWNVPGLPDFVLVLSHHGMNLLPFLLYGISSSFFPNAYVAIFFSLMHYVASLLHDCTMTPIFLPRIIPHWLLFSSGQPYLIITSNIVPYITQPWCHPSFPTLSPPWHHYSPPPVISH